MSVPHYSHSYRFDNFLEETSNLLRKSKASLYFHIIFSTEAVWKDMPVMMEEYSQDGRRHWEVGLLKTQQEDFYILQFVRKNDENEKHSFFWKIMKKGERITILSFSLEKFRFVQSCLNTFVNSSNMEFPWLGSAFLENLDDFIKSTFGADANVEYNKIYYDLEPIGGKGKSQPNLVFSPLSKEQILKKKQDEHKNSHKFLYIRWMKVRVFWKEELFNFSISDKGQILFEKGNLIRFLELVNALRNMSALYRSMAEKHFLVNVNTISLDEGKKADVRIIQQLEVLKLNIINPMTENWYENFTNLFSIPFKPEENLMNFVLMKGNPYFLAQVIDIEKGGSGVYLSATENSIRISPSSETTKISTVLKVVEAVQKYVDPSITIAGA